MDYPISVPGVGLVGGKFVDEDASVGQIGSLIPAAWGNAVTDELLAVIAAAGLEPDEGNLTQLLLALRSSGVFQTPAKFDSTTKVATTEFVQRALGNFADLPAAQITGNRVMLAAEAGSAFWVGNGAGGSFTITLPSLASVPRGASFTFICTSASSNFTIVGAGADVTVTYAGAGVSSGFVGNQVKLRGGEAVELVSNGGYWFVKSGQLHHQDVFKASLVVNGYQKLPSGLIVQWGGGAGLAVYDITLPITFPNANLSAIAVTQGSSAFGYTAEVSNMSNTTLRVTTYRADTGAQASRGISWFAVGY